jgi:transcription-repair coupling factor (superfamily II helicase)
VPRTTPVQPKTTAPHDPLHRIGSSKAVRALLGNIPPHDAGPAAGATVRLVARGSVGSSTAQLVAQISVQLSERAAADRRPLVLVVAHLDEADEAADELVSAGCEPIVLPALEVLPGETALSAELLSARLDAVSRVLTLDAADPARAGAARTVIVAPIQALMQSVPAPHQLHEFVRTLDVGTTTDPGELARWLEEAGYRRVDAIDEPGDLAVRGGLLDIFPPVGAPVRLDFFGDELDRMNEIDLDTMGSDRARTSVTLTIADPSRLSAGSDAFEGAAFLSLVPREAIAVLHETMEVVEQGRGYFERATDGRGIIGPPAVLQVLESRFTALIEVNQFSGGAGSVFDPVDLPVAPLPAFESDTAEALRELITLSETHDVVLCCVNQGEHDRAQELIDTAFDEDVSTAERERIGCVVRVVQRGFRWTSDSSHAKGNDGAAGRSLAVVPYDELLGRFQARRRGGARLKTGRAMDTFLDIQPGDYVVHADHGIARFDGLTLMEPRSIPGTVREHPAAKEPAKNGAKKGSKKATTRGKDAGTDADTLEEYLILEFAGRSRLYVPAMQIDLVQKYVGGFAGKPPLSTIGGKKWGAQKARVTEAVRDLAGELIRVRAARESMPGLRYPGDTPWQRAFEAEFPYDETEDQLAAINEIKRDMQADRPMDRLVCGDVGFGKTEVAIRGAFKACEFGRQVAVLVPTTVLAEQHERTFRGRFADYPFRVESLSRFKTTREVNQTLAAVRKGAVDVIIGTHRLLSKDVRFADLGLVVIDEEQRFGVEHKERLLQMRMTVDVLTLSATPIPRTLHMSLLGIRDISSLTTAPVDRRAIVTDVAPYNEKRIQQAIRRELSRDGQCYFVHNRVHNIESVADEIKKLVPEARVVIGHGQMAPKDLEAVMLKFMRREADVLVATTIIESGIDIPTANTMFINNADNFGLADLHQLRGRVGRYKHRAYCYLLLDGDKSITEVAQKRLKALEQYSMLGAGFKIAMRDLEIRGAGNLLGAEQSGHIAAVGYEMFCRLLEDSVRDLKREAPKSSAGQTSVELGVTGVIPKAYIPSDTRRLEAYRRMATATGRDDLDRLESDLTSAYGTPPGATRRLLELAEVRAAAAGLGVKTVTVRHPDVVFRVPVLTDSRGREDHSAGERVERALSKAKGMVTRLAPKAGEAIEEVYYRPPASYLEPMSLLRVLRARLSEAAVMN